ncbi:MAG: HhoA/HhoB/HtrA family serine endopeptidase [Cyanobacteria bacterium P01_D01_bin.71]
MPTSNSSESSTPQVLFKKRRTATYGLLTLLGTGALVLLNQTTSSEAGLANWLADELAPSAQVISTEIVQTLPPAARNTNFIADAVEQVGPSVVRIDASRTVVQRVPRIFGDPFFREFFGDLGVPEQPRTRVEQGTGSGFIIDANGLILTNAHVIEGAEQVIVTLKDGREFAGEVLGEDPFTDLAVIRVEASALPTVTLGDSEQLRPGEWAIAIGNPLGLDNTVTAGIISATGRSSSQVRVPDKRVSFIQTDAAINPGNSGGPLLNEQGQVIGVNTAIIGGAQGLSFAIPINTAQDIAQELIANGKVDHPYIGIQMRSLTPAVRDVLNSQNPRNLQITADSGVVILGIQNNSPAAQAGLRTGDVITSMAGQAIQDAETVQAIVQNTNIGDALITILDRQGQTVEVTLQPAALPLQ